MSAKIPIQKRLDEKDPKRAEFTKICDDLVLKCIATDEFLSEYGANLNMKIKNVKFIYFPSDIIEKYITDDWMANKIYSNFKFSKKYEFDNGTSILACYKDSYYNDNIESYGLPVIIIYF